MSYEPPQYPTTPVPPQPYGQLPSPSPPNRSAPKWPWIIGIVAAFIIGVCTGAVGSGDQQPPSAARGDDPVASESPTPMESSSAPSSTSSASPEPTVRVVTMPDLVGENASVAADELERLGFTNIQFGSADADEKVVLLPQNWTVKSQSPKPGKKVRTDRLVVLTCTKKD